MLNYKYLLLAGGLSLALIPENGRADTCSTLPNCTDIGFAYTAEQCGDLKKLKCPFGNSYFCSVTTCTPVTVASDEVCTKYCEKDASMCIEKRKLNCLEYVSKNKGIIFEEDGQPLSGTISNDIYLIGNVVAAPDSSYSNPLTFKTIQIYDASEIPACAEELQGRTAFLTIPETSNFVIEGSAYFHVAADITMHHEQSFAPGFTATFGKDTKLYMKLWGTGNKKNGDKLIFQGYDIVAGAVGEETHNQLNLYCSPYQYNAGDGTTTYCSVDIEFNDAYVNLCQDLDRSYSNRWAAWNTTCTGGREDSNGQWQENLSCDTDYYLCKW